MLNSVPTTVVHDRTHSQDTTLDLNNDSILHPNHNIVEEAAANTRNHEESLDTSKFETLLAESAIAQEQFDAASMSLCDITAEIRDDQREDQPLLITKHKVEANQEGGLVIGQ